MLFVCDKILKFDISRVTCILINFQLRHTIISVIWVPKPKRENKKKYSWIIHCDIKIQEVFFMKNFKEFQKKMLQRELYICILRLPVLKIAVDALLIGFCMYIAILNISNQLLRIEHRDIEFLNIFLRNKHLWTH